MLALISNLLRAVQLTTISGNVGARGREQRGHGPLIFGKLCKGSPLQTQQLTVYGNGYMPSVKSDPNFKMLLNVIRSPFQVEDMVLLLDSVQSI